MMVYILITIILCYNQNIKGVVNVILLRSAMSVIDSQSTDCFYRIMMVSFFLLLYILFEATPCHAANFLTPEERQWLIVNNGNVRPRTGNPWNFLMKMENTTAWWPIISI